jgi:hypothetical protein
MEHHARGGIRVTNCYVLQAQVLHAADQTRQLRVHARAVETLCPRFRAVKRVRLRPEGAWRVTTVRHFPFRSRSGRPMSRPMLDSSTPSHCQWQSLCDNHGVLNKPTRDS